MTDSPLVKGFWLSIRAGIKWIFHVTLIPAVAALKAMISGITYLHDELAKF